MEYGAYQVNNNSITPNQGDRFWSNLGTMAVNHDQLFYLIKHDDTIALNYGKIKMNTLPLDFSPNGMYEATDDYFITADNLMKMLPIGYLIWKSYISLNWMAATTVI